MLDTSMILALILLFISILYFLGDSVFTLIVIISIIMAIPYEIVLIYSGSIVYAIITEAIVIAIIGYWIRGK